jgi:pyruvate formate lyase activating enzyme
MTPADAATPQWNPALLAAPGRDGRVRCELCPFRCVLAEGRTGICAVRRNSGGQLQTATLTVAAAHVDAVERKPFYHFRPGSRVLTVAAPGCTFRCDYCVNHRLSQFGRDVTAPWTGEPANPGDLVARAAAENAAIGLSYSEPGLAPELTLELARLARPLGIPVVWKSNGFLTPEAIALVAPVLAAVNIDVKAADDDDHRRLTGAPLAPVLDAIAQFHAAGVWVEVSTPLVTGTADTIGALTTIARRVAAVSPELPWHLVRFTPDYRLAGGAPTSPALLEAATAVGRAAGLRFVYVERALGPAGRRTDCPGCGAAQIERDVWSVRENLLKDGACASCGRTLPGVWR